MLEGGFEWSPYTRIGSVFAEVETLSHPDNERFNAIYLPIVQRESTRKRCFLSVVMRTQGRRHKELFEALQSLVQQKDHDFEVIVVCHNTDDNAFQSVREVLSDRAFDTLALRTLRIEGGSRATPLNYGFAHSAGEYIACLDDDDTVYENWVSCFHEAAARCPRTMLHTQIVLQDWNMGKDGSFPCGEANTIYCAPYNEITQLCYNRCPLHSVALPAYLFRHYGVIFDEELTTVEDWDMLIRVQRLAGVTEVSSVTGIYKRWKNRENSSTVHNREEWMKNERRVRNNIAKSLYIISSGGVNECIRLVQRNMELESWTTMQDARIHELNVQNNTITLLNNNYKAIVRAVFPFIYFFTGITYCSYSLFSKITSGKLRKKFFAKKELWNNRRNFLRQRENVER